MFGCGAYDFDDEMDYFGTAMENGFPMAVFDLARAEERAKRKRAEELELMDLLEDDGDDEVF